MVYKPTHNWGAPPCMVSGINRNKHDQTPCFSGGSPLQAPTGSGELVRSPGKNPLTMTCPHLSAKPQA